MAACAWNPCHQFPPKISGGIQTSWRNISTTPFSLSLSLTFSLSLSYFLCIPLSPVLSVPLCAFLAYVLQSSLAFVVAKGVGDLSVGVRTRSWCIYLWIRPSVLLTFMTSYSVWRVAFNHRLGKRTPPMHETLSEDLQGLLWLRLCLATAAYWIMCVNNRTINYVDKVCYPSYIIL